jgi:hypothetical protein
VEVQTCHTKLHSFMLILNITAHVGDVMEGVPDKFGQL